ncbi:MAG: response regulator [Acidobacteriota bacterium]|nr:MAG: response regulator [Acidobacteriota bacterium]
MTERPKILLADDSVTMRKVAELAFGDAGMDVSTAIDGQTAMEAFVREQPDIVLADVGLTGTSGYQICEMIKQDEATNHIPVLLMVGAFEPFDQAEAERVGADGFLMKPFNPIREVISKIRELLDRDGNSETVSFNISDSASEARSELDDIESLYESSLVETTRVEEVFLGDMLPPNEAEPDDDELIEKETPSAAAASPFERIVDDEIFDEPEQGDDLHAEFSETIEISHPTENIDIDLPAIEAESAEVEENLNKVEEEPSESIGLFDEPATADIPPPPAVDVTEEMIDRIVERVLAKLSDSVVRDVALEEVPRVAERLMREALEQEIKE